MEVSILPKSSNPFSELLSDGYVEARLHTDGTTNIDRILGLREKWDVSVTNPIYLIIDPKTEREIDRFEGGAVGAEKLESFKNMLVSSREDPQS
ncbi:MAG: hypothetical protein ACI8QS_000005 [Planctomycetota bacterium]|jgi:hypothetical protein